MYGQITAEFNSANFEQLCHRYFAGFDTSRFSVVAVRLYCAREIVLTVYAEDKLNKNHELPENKFPVKKFKTELKSTAELLEVMSAYNFTVADPAYNVDEMEVMNR